MSTLQRRFVDQDVRDMPGLREVAVTYVENYTGEFPYLVDMAFRLSSGYGLTDAMVRGILNCMAGDPKVNLDIPEAPEPSAYGNVVQFRKPTKLDNKRRFTEYDCPLFANGIFHHHKRNEPWEKEGPRMKHCPGLYRINREMFMTKADSPARYIVANSGGVIHKKRDTWCIWYPNQHEPGYIMGPQLHGDGECGTQVFRNPRLIDTIENVPDLRPTFQGKFLRPCKRCFEEES